MIGTQQLYQKVSEQQQQFAMQKHEQSMSQVLAHPIVLRSLSLIDQLKANPDSQDVRSEIENLLKSSLLAIYTICQHGVDELQSSQISPLLRDAVETIEGLLDRTSKADDVSPAPEQSPSEHGANS